MESGGEGCVTSPSCKTIKLLALLHVTCDATLVKVFQGINGRVLNLNLSCGVDKRCNIFGNMSQIALYVYCILGNLQPH